MGCSFSAPKSDSDGQYGKPASLPQKPVPEARPQWDSAASAMENGQHNPSFASNHQAQQIPFSQLKRNSSQKDERSRPSPFENGVTPPLSNAISRAGMASAASTVDNQNRQAALQSLPSRVTQELSQYRDSDDESDDAWDRYGFNDEEGYSSGHTAGSSGGKRQEPEPNKRAEETSIFGLTNKRRQEPLRETKSLKLAKLRGCTFVNQYVVIKYLGRGACGRVFLCMDMNDNRLYAVKIVKKVDLEAQRGPRQNQRRKRNPIDDLRREVSIMRTLRHKNIVTLQEVVDDPSGSKMLLVMDYMEGGPVMTREALERGRCIPESLACQYFRDMCKALDYLHFNKVVHGDLKPENVLMSARGAVTLSDFGCSKVIISGNEYLERCNGTPAFLAPEMMRPQSRYRGRPTDMYALGACLYTFAFGRIPFNAPNVFKLFQIVQNEPLTFPSRPQVSPLLQDLLLRLLHKDPKQRITMSQVMKHPWVTKRGQWPLKSVREMIKETGKIDDDDVILPDLMSTYNVLDVPRQDHLLEVLKPGLPEHTYWDGEVLLRQGDQGTHLMYILSGEVEVLVKLPPIRDTRTDAIKSGQNGLQSRGTETKTSEPPEVIGDDLPPALLEGASKAKEFTSTLARGPREYLVAVRKAGQFVGEMSSFTTAAARCATVRAKGTVKVNLIPGELLHDCVERIPEARQQAKEMLWMRQSENMVLEAMTRLSAVHDALEEMLGANANTTEAATSLRSNASGRQTFRR